MMAMINSLKQVFTMLLLHSVEESSSDTSGDGVNESEIVSIVNDVNKCGEMQVRSDDGSVNSTLKAVSFILLVFQLKFRVADRAITFLLSFLRGLICSLISMIPCSVPLEQIYECFPKSLHSLRQQFSAKCYGGVTDFVVCPKCSTLYTRDECIVTIENSMISKTCSFIEFPNHPQRHRIFPCGDLLMKQVKYGSAIKLVPKKTYTYNSVITALKTILLRPGILKQCNEWRRFVAKDGVMNDVIDGRIWKEFRFVYNRPFLDVPNNVGLALNMDWFNPYEHAQYSIGAIYLTILNLPREEHYKVENTILVGLMPGPSEPKRIDPFLSPLVDELMQLWEGVGVSANTMSTFTLRAALLCFISDIPATRKVCGFPGFRAKLGCSKCLKEFPCEGFGERTGTYRDGVKRKRDKIGMGV